MQFGRVIKDCVFYYQDCLSDIADVRGGIAVDRDEVGEFARGDGALDLYRGA